LTKTIRLNISTVKLHFFKQIMYVVLKDRTRINVNQEKNI